MADRGRDLKFSILSDAGRFDLDGAADELDKLADAGDTAGDSLEQLEDHARSVSLDAIKDEAQTAGRELEQLDDTARAVDLDKLGDDARRTARELDAAFDKIGRSSREGARKVDDSTDKMGDSLKEVGDEAGQTAREAAASFSSGGDIGDAFQELAANAGVAFGPIGLALGAAAAVGIGLFKSEADKIKTKVDDIVEYMKEAGGKLNGAAIDAMVSDPENRGELKRLKDLAKASDIAGVSFRDLARAKFGDKEAQKRLNDALDEAARKYAKTTDEAGNYSGANDLMRARIKVLRQELRDGARATELAEEAMSDLTTATGTAGAQVDTTASQAGGAWDDLRANLGRPIKARVVAQAPTASEIARIRSGIMRGIGTIPVSLRVSGQSIYTNNANNDRYRW